MLMMVRRTVHAASLLPVLAVAALALCGGCSSPSRGEKMVQTFDLTRRTVWDGQRRVDATQRALDAMRTTRADMLNDSFRNYKEAVEKLEATGAQAKERATAMQEEADAHVKAWEKEVGEINDPAIKASMESRRAAVRANFGQVKAAAQEARKAYDPYLAGNQQIVKSLSIEMSPAAITGLSAPIDRVQADGATLKEKLGALDKVLDRIAKGESAAGATK
jgi:hypothetical protein